jgi:DNA-binding transcriptional ArsR family regulator
VDLGFEVRSALDIFQQWNMVCHMTGAVKSADVFNALAGVHRREVLDALVGGEKAVGTLVSELSMPQPQVSKHLRVLSAAGLVKCRAEGRRRLYQLDPAHLSPIRDWLAKYERVIEARLDQMDDYLKDLQAEGEPR